MDGQGHWRAPLTMRIGLISVLILFTGYACLSVLDAQWTNDLINNPRPIPKYLTAIIPYPGTRAPFGGSVCFSLLSSALFEPGNQADELIGYLASHRQLTVDGHTLPDKSAHIAVFDIRRAMYDERGSLVGTSGGTLQICYHIPLTDGLHRANVEVSSMSGRRYSYIWAFEVN
jgi:hypothetical protein